MARTPKARQPFNIMIVGQAGRLQYEALLFVASLRANSPGFRGRMIVAEPQPGPLWTKNPRMRAEISEALVSLGAEIVPFANAAFGQSYPYGNKIEGLAALPANEPFVFFDSDTLVTGELTDIAFDFNRPTASMRRTNTWPVEDLYWPGYTATWKSLYDRFDINFDTSLDMDEPDEYWKRYLYFNAGWFVGPDPRAFGKLFTKFASSIKSDPPAELVLQPLDPWLDQVALPLVIHALGGGRPGPELDGLDGDITCHYRAFPLLYARESEKVIGILEDLCAPNKVKKLLKDHEPLKKMVYHGQGRKARALFDQDNLPTVESKLRNKLRANGYWLR